MMFDTTYALRLTVPPSAGQPDIIIPGPELVSASNTLIYDYIQLVNQYLRWSLTLIVFMSVLTLGFKYLTSMPGSTNQKDAILNILISTGAGVVIVMMSYLIVRLVINLM